MSTRMMSFIVPPAASMRCLILVSVSFAWLYVEPSPSTPPLPSPAVMPATNTWLPYIRQFDQVPGAGSFRCGLVTRVTFMASPLNMGATHLEDPQAPSVSRRRLYDGAPWP